MKNYNRAKTIFAAFLVTCVLFFTNDCQLIDVQKTAIIVALGIDTAEDNQLEITAQIAIPQATDTQSSNSDAVLTAKGKTLFDALDNIGVTTGWYPKLAFCNLIVLGNDLVRKDFLPVIDYMLSSDRFVNSAILAAAEGKAKDILSSPTPLDFISSFALEKILIRDIDRANTVLVADIRKFAQDVRSESGFSYLPLIKKIKTDDKPKGDSQDEESGGDSSETAAYRSIIALSELQGGGSAGKGGQDDDSNQGEKNVFDARSALLFSNGVYACTVNDEQTLCYNALKEPVSEAFFQVSYQKKNKNIDSVVSVVKTEKNITMKIKNGIPEYTATLKMFCKTEEISADPDTGKLAFYTKASPECLNALSEKVKQNLMEMFTTAKDKGCDAFEMKNYIYRHIHDKYASYKDCVLDVVKVNFSITCVNNT